jgi:hypothetical protein
MVNPTEVPSKIQHAEQRLKKGQRVNRITVRDFLGHFGVARRGAVKVEAIRKILDSLDLQTDPDFETVWIDEPILLRLKNGVLTTHAVPAATNGLGDDQASIDTEEIVLESTPSILLRF